MTETEIQAQIEQKTAEIAALKAEAAALRAGKDWPAFLALPWEEQRHLRELIPGQVAELERAHFRNLKGA